MALVTIEEFAGYLKRDLDEFDAYTAQQLLDGASAAVVEYCGWHIAPVITETVTVDGTGTVLQTLPTLNLVALNGVDENGLSLDPGRIDWSTNGVLEKRSGGWWTSRRRGVITDITHGLPATPRWVATLIFAAAGRVFLDPTMSPETSRSGAITQESSGGESVTYAAMRVPTLPTAPAGTTVLLDIERRMLDRLRIPVAA